MINAYEYAASMLTQAREQADALWNTTNELPNLVGWRDTLSQHLEVIMEILNELEGEIDSWYEFEANIPDEPVELHAIDEEDDDA